MQIANSKLFQEFSGQFLREMYGRGTLSVLSESLSGGMDGVVQYLMNRSSLEVIAVNIRNATTDSFNISIECRVTGTGPISSTVAPMTVDLLFNSSRFGRMRLPEIHTSVWGTTVLIMEQEVAVSDMDTYRAYVRSIITAEETSFRLDNGDCKIRALGLGAGCKYEMEVPMRGMDGLRAELDSIERTDDGQIAVDLRLQNPSPVQIDHGMTTFEIRTVEGVVVARLSGILQILRGTFTVNLRGSLMDGGKRTESTRLRLMGVGTKDASWCNETIQYVDTVIETEEKHRRAFGLEF